jgi:hypothetical protein
LYFRITALREEHRLRESEKYIGPKKEDVPGEWRKLHSEENYTRFEVFNGSEDSSRVLLDCDVV